MESMGANLDFSFFQNKKVLITGNTGFKGSWMTMVLLSCGAKVYGYALKPEKESLFNILGLEKNITQKYADIRNLMEIKRFVAEVNPDILIHMAAQPLVQQSYQQPVYTYEVNVMGTVNVMEAIRYADSLKSVVNVTTDKVYQNNEWEWGYRESDCLNGFDPYSNSKSCSELVTSSYVKCFLKDRMIAVSTCRAGNVIGGGDFSEDRIIPDCVKAAYENKCVVLRNPNSIRPYQHVLEPVVAYLQIAMLQYQNNEVADCYNIGPKSDDCITTKELVECFCKAWGENFGFQVSSDYRGGHEAGLLKLDISKIKNRIGWSPCHNVYWAVVKTVEWSKTYYSRGDIIKETQIQVKEYLRDRKIIISGGVSDAENESD